MTAGSQALEPSLMLPQLISRELGWNWSSQNSNWYACGTLASLKQAPVNFKKLNFLTFLFWRWYTGMHILVLCLGKSVTFCTNPTNFLIIRSFSMQSIISENNATLLLFRRYIFSLSLPGGTC